MVDKTIMMPELYTFEDAIKWYATCMRVSEKEAREEAERLVAQIMKDEDCERDFAVWTFVEDTEKLTPVDLDAIERHAKESGAIKYQAKAVDAYGKKRARERKINTDKRTIIDALACCVDNYDGNVNITNPEREIVFTYNGDVYKITLSKNRKKKD